MRKMICSKHATQGEVTTWGIADSWARFVRWRCLILASKKKEARGGSRRNLSSGSRGPWGPGPLAPMISSKSCSFQVILWEKPYFEQSLGSGPPGSKLHWAPLTKILDPSLDLFHPLTWKLNVLIKGDSGVHFSRSNTSLVLRSTRQFALVFLLFFDWIEGSELEYLFSVSRIAHVWEVH